MYDTGTYRLVALDDCERNILVKEADKLAFLLALDTLALEVSDFTYDSSAVSVREQ